MKTADRSAKLPHFPKGSSHQTRNGDAVHIDLRSIGRSEQLAPPADANQIYRTLAIQQREPELMTGHHSNGVDSVVADMACGDGDSVSCTTSHRSTPSAVPIGASPNPLIAGISPISAGLTLVNVLDASCLAHVRLAVTNLALEKSSVLGIPFHQDIELVLSVYSGNCRQLQQAQLFAAANPPSITSVPLVTKTCSAQDKLDWTSNEGQHVLLPIIDGAKGSVILEQGILGQITPAISQGLMRIGNAAQKAGVGVLFIVVCSGGQQKSQLSHVCDEYIEVAPCEPDIGVDMAFSIDCVGIRDLNSLGIGKTMCSVKLSDGVFHRRYDPYISACFETRIMWILRGQGKTLEEIGSILKKDKSTILRRLQGLPVPRYVEMGQDWLDRNLESYATKSA